MRVYADDAAFPNDYIIWDDGYYLVARVGGLRREFPGSDCDAACHLFPVHNVGVLKVKDGKNVWVVVGTGLSVEQFG